MEIVILPAIRLQGTIQVPGDKSISHRALILGSLAQKKTCIRNLLLSEDVQSTWTCLQNLGVNIKQSSNQPNREITIQGVGKNGFQAPFDPINCGNSGTTMRLLMGILAGQPFQNTLIGDSSLQKRPMNRVAIPLRQMGTSISLSEQGTAPVQMLGKHPLQAISYELTLASAQVKSAILLAGLLAEGTTQISGKIESRDHTERMLLQFGVSIERTETNQGQILSLAGQQKLQGTEIEVPGDFSSAAFWLAAATLVPNSEIFLSRVSLNQTRTGLLSVLRRMGANIEEELLSPPSFYKEPIGNLRVRSASLQGTQVNAEEIPFLIDELPILAILASQAQGKTSVFGAEELRFKETDRISVLAQNLADMGIQITTFADGFSIEGPQTLKGATIFPKGDHRMAMAFSIAALLADKETTIQGAECTFISYPTFYNDLKKIKNTNS